MVNATRFCGQHRETIVWIPWPYDYMEAITMRLYLHHRYMIVRTPWRYDCADTIAI